MRLNGCQDGCQPRLENELFHTPHTPTEASGSASRNSQPWLSTRLHVEVWALARRDIDPVAPIAAPTPFGG
jgi:hypothetical protein